MQHTSYTFKQLCWQSGFIVTSSSMNHLNKPALCEYLHVTKRTLNRWLAGEPACPRATQLLKMRLKQLNPTWQHFYYDRHNHLGHVDWAHTYAPSEVQMFPALLAERFRLRDEKKDLITHFELTIDKKNQQSTQDALFKAIKMLQDVSTNQLFAPHDHVDCAPMILADAAY